MGCHRMEKLFFFFNCECSSVLTQILLRFKCITVKYLLSMINKLLCCNYSSMFDFNFSKHLS